MGTTNIDKHELWQQRVDDYRASGLSAKDFCEAQSYSFYTLRSWMYKLKSESKNASTSGFVKLTPCESTTEIESDLILKYNQYAICIPKQYHEPTLLRLLESLRKC